MKTRIEQGCTRIHSGVAWLGLKEMCKNGGYENTKQKCRIAWIGLEMNGVKIGGDLLGNLEMPKLRAY